MKADLSPKSRSPKNTGQKRTINTESGKISQPGSPNSEKDENKDASENGPIQQKRQKAQSGITDQSVQHN